MTTKRRILSLVLVTILVLFSCVAISCENSNKGEGPTPGGTNEPTKTEWPEAGVYYFDDVNYENTLTLNVGGTFSLYVKGELSAGKYTLTDSQLVLDFNAEGAENVTATYEGSVISLTHKDASMRFLKKLNYTVTFNVDGGSTVESQTVLNGKSATKPADPTRDGYVFVGWYADATFETAYAFGASPVTADTTVYARWIAENVTGKEFTVQLNANYEGAPALESVATAGGKLFDLPTLERQGYTFGGWWFSTESNGEKLSYKCEDTTVLTENTTLYALWIADSTGTKLTAPVVNVTAGNISWNLIEGARTYEICVIGEDGEVLVDTATAATVLNVPFADFSAGTYQITVTAKANSGEQNDATATRYYVNKALSKVSEFIVDGSTLVFNTVENAEKYLITVVCGNPEHNHTAFDNGSSRTFNFTNCTMTEDGIKFTVTAMADGYASSTSDVFTFKRVLSSVGGFRIDEATQTLIWNEVASAESYMVSVKCGNEAHNHEFVNFGTQNFVSLKECDALEGGIVVKVYPKTEGYFSPAASEFVYNKTVLATPADLLLNGNVLSWSTVEGADKYEVTVNGTAYECTEASFDLTPVLDVVEGVDYTLTVRAKGASNSLASDAIVARYYEMNPNVSYAAGTLSWAPVLGAQYYELQVNDGEIVRVEGGVSTAAVTLTQKGANLVKVRFVDGKNVSDWATTTVVAHRITFDTLGGSFVGEQFKAVGDPITLPTTEKVGYDFVAWYNVPGGASSNGAAYEDAIFTESGDIVLYGYYSAKKYDVTYNYGAGGTGSLTSDKVSYDGHYTLTVPTASSIAGAFGGWFSAPYGMGIQYTDGNGNSLAPWNHTEGKELYAFWIDETLSFSLTKVNGKDAYAVSKGSRIDLVTELTIPASYRGIPVALVAANGFVNCSNLEVINLPETIEQISLISPFAGCSSLAAINVYDVEGVAAPVFTSEDGVLLDIGTQGKTKIALVPMAKTGTFRIPAGVTEIPEAAFAGSSLSKVIIPSAVTTIGREAFKDAASLTSVVFEVTGTPAPLTIGTRAFMNCTKLEKITLPARLTEINLQRYTIIDNAVSVTETENAFTGCTALKSINVSASNQNYKTIDNVLYSKDGRTLLFVPASLQGEFIVPDGTRNIEAGAFVGCHFITDITLPGSLVLVGECAFYGMENLQTVTLNGGALNDLEIGKYAFRDCKDLDTVILNDGSRLAKLGDGAFWGCRDLASFTFPATMSTVGASAFAGCTSLETVTFAASERSLAFGENAFMNCTTLKTVNLPANVTKIPGVFAGCSSLEAVNVDSASQYLTSEDGVVYNKDKTEIVFFPQGKSGDFTLPATVTTINNGVFQNVTLGTLTIGNAVTVIGDDAFNSATIDAIVFTGDANGTLTIGANAFRSAKLGTLTLPAHTVEIGNSAFYETTAESIVLNNGLVTLGDYAFWGAQLELTIPASVKTIGAYCFGGYREYDYDLWEYVTAFPTVTLTVENSQLETIGDYAFDGNIYLGDLVIPSSVKTIGNYAFYGCEELGSVTFAGTSSLETIGAFAFSCSSSYDASYDFTEIIIPASVKSIGAYAFANTNLETVIFEDGSEDLVIGTTFVDRYYNESMGTYATDIYTGHTFNYCNHLETVKLPSRLTVLEKGTFRYAGSDEMSVTIEGETPRLTTIGEECFYGSSLVSFVIPKSVSNQPVYTDPVSGETYDRLGIGANAFCGLFESLTSITFEMGGDLPLTIGANAFDNAAKLTSIVLPARLASYTSYTGEVIAPLANGALVFNSCDSLTSVTVEDKSGAYYTSVSGVLMTADQKELVYYPMAREGEFSVPATVTKIHDYAFNEATKLTTLTFVGGTADMTIGAYAFARCSALTSLVLPNNVVSLGESAFLMCSELTSLTLSTKLGNFAPSMISACNKLATINVGTDGQGTYFSSVNGVLYSADKSSLIIYPRAKTDAEITVDANVKVIYTNAFANNNNIQKVVLPEGLIEIQTGAFDFCAGLLEVNIPSTVQKIDKNAFRYCEDLTTVTFAEGGDDLLIIGDYAFGYTYELEPMALPARVYSIGNSAFYESGITTLTFAENSSLVSVGDNAFNSSALVQLELPAGVVSIGSMAFFECSDLLEITFNEGLISVGDYAFAGSNQLISVSFPASLKTLGASVFYYCDYDEYTCSSLESVTFAPNSQLEKIPVGTFAYTAIKTFTVPASVTVIEGTESDPSYRKPSAFYETVNLESVFFELGSKCSEIGAYTFESSTLKTIELPTSVSTIGAYAFRYCYSLESIMIPETATNLGKGAFWQCSSLSDLDFRSKTTEITEDLFYGCESLTEITIPASVSIIASDAFSGAGLSAINVDPRNTYFKSIDGILYTADGTGIVTIPSNKVITEFVVPNTVTVIGDKLFYGVESLETLVFEDGRTEPITIGYMAFAKCYNLRSVIFTEQIGSIGEEAFYDCAALAFVELASDMIEDVFGYDAFYACSSLVEICNKSQIELEPGDRYSCGGIASYALRIFSEGESAISFVDGFTTLTDGDIVYLISYTGTETNVTIPEGITHIYTYAFSNCDVEHVTFASTVKEIMDGAFYESSVKSVTLNEGLEKIGYMAFYYSDLASIVLPSTLKEIGEEAFYSASLFGVIAIPESVEKIGYKAFYYVDDVITFLVSASEAPDGWESGWDKYDYSNNHMVLWGFTGEEITYNFETNGGAAIDSITSGEPITLPADPTRDGFVFVGWYNTPEFDGSPIVGTYYNGTLTTLYAKWMSEEEANKGQSMDTPAEPVSGYTFTVKIMNGGDQNYYVFTVEAGETWNITTGGSGDHMIWFYNADQDCIDDYDYNYSENYDYTFEEAGTYYIGIGYYSSYNTGEFEVTFTKK